ncbi:hypothetical protein [Bdellovibrio sp.]|uniref:hypothetical protein n=1 Tax=Bdellovibrio sp. TaxID=28201 RepID=UPI0032215084
MKLFENKYDKSVILLKLVAIMATVAMAGCNSDGVEKYEKTEPISPAPAYRYCTSKDLVDLRVENEKLAKAAEEEGEMGTWMLFYIYGPPGGFGTKTEVDVSRLPYAAKLMNSFKKMYDNCKEFSNCVIKDGTKPYIHPVTDSIFQGGSGNICAMAASQVQGFISDIYAYSWRDHAPASLCSSIGKVDENGKAEVVGTSPELEIVLTEGIKSLDTMTDQSKAESFKSELKTLCDHYRQIDYCGLNKKEVYDACNKAFGTKQE